MPTFEKIHLPSLLIADLYTDQLVLIDEPQLLVSTLPSQQTLPTENSTTYKHENVGTNPIVSHGKTLHVLGSFEKQVAIILYHPTAVHTDEASLDLLNKMLLAVKLSLADVAIINLAHNELGFPFTIKNQPPKAILLFGVAASALQLPLQVPHFQVSQWSNCKWLFLPDLQKFNEAGTEQITLKTQLWMALKTMFDIA